MAEHVFEDKKEKINVLILQALLDLHQISHEPAKNIKNFIVEKCIEITGSKLAYVGFINEDVAVLKTTFWSKNIVEMCRIEHDGSLEFNIKEGGLWAESIRQKRPIIINDYDGPDPLKKGMPEGHIPIKRFMGIPVLDKDKVVMAGCFANKEEPYDENDVRHAKLLLQGFWNYIKLSRAQENLRESELKYRSLFENANDAIFLLKGNKFIDCNTKALEMFRCSKEQIIGKTPDEFSPPQLPNGRYSNKEASENIRLALKDKIPSFEWVHSTLDGTPFYTEVSLSGLTIGKETYILALVRDITKRKKAEAQLKHERGRYSLLVEHMPYGLVLLDKRGRFIYVNNEWVRLFGYAQEELPDGKTWFKKAYPDKDYRRMIIEMWLKDMKNVQIGERIPMVFNVTCKDGSVKIINFIAVLVENDLFITTAYDITDYRRIEEQFLQAQKMEAIGRLAGGIAHDFNNMLTVILGHTQLALLNLDATNPLHHRFLEIEKAGQRSAELTRNLLAFARKQTISPTVIDLNNIIDDMLKMLHRLIGENIELIWIPGNRLWHVNLDPAQLNQVIVNLIVNARDAIKDIGTITIETNNIVLDQVYCKSHPGFEPGEYVMLAISDNGIGMGKDTLEHIFEPFFTTKDVDKGSGLGLPTVYGIIKQNNGFINVYSEPKKGTTFKIYIPRLEGDTAGSQVSENTDIAMSKGETVLVVEDERDVLDLCVYMLEELGYKVIAANRPTEAIKGIRDYKGDIHLLITDVIMPEMNGKELATAIKEIRPIIKCLFMSGYANNAIVHNGIIMDDTTYLQKPFTFHDLSFKIREALGR